MQIIDILNSPWAIQEEKLLQIRALYFQHAHGDKPIDIAAVEQAMGRKLENKYREVTVLEGGVAVLPIQGVLAKRMNMFAEISGGTSMQLMQRDFAAAMDDPDVHSIVLDIDSPGGEVSGTQDFAAMVFAARGKKPIVAVCNGLMGSGAYWIGSSADKVYLTADTDMVGSIGVVITHADMSKAEEKRGVKVTEITAGKYKRIASEHEPLSTEGHDTLKAMVDDLYTVFVDGVAQNRGVSSEKVLSDMADGRIFIGKKAVTAGLVDGVKNLNQVVAQLQSDRRQLLYPNRNSATALNSSGGTQMETKDKENPTATAADITAMRKQAFDEGYKAGSDGERARIQAVQEQAHPGHEELVTKLAFDGKTTGPEAAVQILAAERKKLGTKAADLISDAGKAAAHTTAEDLAKKGKTAEVTADMKPDEVRTIAAEEWKNDPELHREFRSVEAYQAYRVAEASGRIRILNKTNKAS